MVLRTTGQSAAEATAIALSNQRMEEIRNLPYQSIGTLGGIPSGNIPQVENIVRNQITFTIRTTIIYIDDPYDDLAPIDTLAIDYKRIRVAVSWSGWLGGEIVLITDVAPKGVENTQGGGLLKISVFNASGNPISQADVHVQNIKVTPNIDAFYKTDNNGLLLLAGAPTSTDGYNITVSKAGFSQERTYDSSEIADPAKPPASVFQGQITEISFAIDKLSSFSITTRAREGFDDDFNNANQIASSTNIEIISGQAQLQEEGGIYKDIGTIESEVVSPTVLLNWDRFYFIDSQPTNSHISYQILFATDTTYKLVPDSDLPGNAAGFSISPINLSALDVNIYSTLKIRAILSTTDPSLTPAILDWHLIYNTPLISNLYFHLRSSKILGINGSGLNVYKLSQTFRSGASGDLTIPDLEWDSYLFSATSTTGMNLVETVPSTALINLLPDTLQSVVLYFQTQNQLLVKVQDASSTVPIFGGTVRVTNSGLGYDANELTNSRGEAFFIPLAVAQYNVEVQATGYQTATTSVNVSGSIIKDIALVQQ